MYKYKVNCVRDFLQAQKDSLFKTSVGIVSTRKFQRMTTT